MSHTTSEKPSTRLTIAEYQTLAGFRYHLRRFLQFSEQAAQTAGLTPRQYQALLAIKGFPNRDRVTIAELAEQLPGWQPLDVCESESMVSLNYE
jgi:hypothetical protein